MHTIFEHNSLRILCDCHLLDCYRKAVELDIDEAFVAMLEAEIEKRNLTESIARSE